MPTVCFPLPCALSNVLDIIYNLRVECVDQQHGVAGAHFGSGLSGIGVVGSKEEFFPGNLLPCSATGLQSCALVVHLLCTEMQSRAIDDGLRNVKDRT